LGKTLPLPLTSGIIFLVFSQETGSLLMFQTVLKVDMVFLTPNIPQVTEKHHCANCHDFQEFNGKN
jgi:uncharacterized membrane protein (UPF0127 family)